MDNNDLVFKPEEPYVPDEFGMPEKHPWKILIVDDEPDIHTTTRLVLKNFEFEGEGLEFLSAYTGYQAVEVMQSNPGIALVLLDVVMETSHAGLDCARTIREELGNRLVRIILRTGQPGEAPERQVIIDYDINDYKHKTELTAQRLFTAVYTGIRSYRDMLALEKNRMGLRYIIEASGECFKERSIRKMVKGVLTQITALCRIQNSFFLGGQGFALARGPKSDWEVIAAIGKYEGENLNDLYASLNPSLKEQLIRVSEQKKTTYIGNDYIGYFPTQNDTHHILYMENCKKESSRDYSELFDLFGYNVGVALDNVYLNKEILETQQEIIHLLGEIVENRSKETAFHVIRVAEYTGLMCEPMGVDRGKAQLIKSASPMHDVGKIAIPDLILLKPGGLTPEETQVMKSHTVIGHRILNSSSRELLQMAATIALCHHEHWDGTGYPRGLKGTDIPLAGRLTCIADVFDALSSNRVYKQAWSMDRSFRFLEENMGTIFDPEMVAAFLAQKEKILEIRAMYTKTEAEDENKIVESAGIFPNQEL